MNKAYLGLGSNLGDRNHYLEEAIKLIGNEAGKVTLVSSVYETEAWGVDDQPGYLNSVLEIQTNLYPFELLKSILSVEKALGRERKQKWGSRTIDIDLLLYEDYHFNSCELTLPHPWIQDRKFVLIPLSEIAGDLIHPVKQKTIYDLLLQCPDQASVKKV